MAPLTWPKKGTPLGVLSWNITKIQCNLNSMQHLTTLHPAFLQETSDRGGGGGWEHDIVAATAAATRRRRRRNNCKIWRGRRRRRRNGWQLGGQWRRYSTHSCSLPQGPPLLTQGRNERGREVCIVFVLNEIGTSLWRKRRQSQ